MIISDAARDELREVIKSAMPYPHCRSCDQWLCDDKSDEVELATNADKVLAAVLKFLREQV